MHPHRRLRMLLLAVLAIVIFILYLTGDARRVQNQKFYQQTVEAMEAKAARKQYEDEANLFQKLRPVIGEERVVAAERQSYDRPSVPKKDFGDDDNDDDDNNNNKSKNSGTVLEGNGSGASDDIESPDEISIAGRKKMPGPGNALQPPEPEREKDEEREEDPEVESELNSILKRSPIIVFSKTYCPYSKKAKRILLERYHIVPSVFVVELDEHPLGQKLQDFLAENTGRKTVPNVLVNGRSIGGGDDIEALDESGELASKIRELTGKRVMEIWRKDDEKAL
ncbi:hypothetical protein VTO42DRAFT_6478 [Malbranchea cinnamomea]